MDKVFLKGLHLLETLVLSEEPRGVTDLSTELGLTKSNVHRLLQALVHRGFVQKDHPTGKYVCTFKMWQFGVILGERIEVKRVAEPFLAKLAERTQETVHLSVLDGSEVVYVHKIDSPHPVRAYSTIGGRAPSHCVATGKALLAFMPGDAVATLGELKEFTERTITDPKLLQRELLRIREMGYAVNRGEWRATVGGMAAPIFDARRECCAAVGISGPMDRMTPVIMRELAPVVIETAAAISRELGFSGTPRKLTEYSV